MVTRMSCSSPASIDASRAASAVLYANGFGDDDAPDPTEIARELGFEVRFATVIWGMPGRPCTYRGRPTIFVHENPDIRNQQVWISRAIGAWVADARGICIEREPRWPSAFGRALLVPTRPLRELWAATGDVQALLRHWRHVPPTWVAERLYEVASPPGDGCLADRLERRALLPSSVPLFQCVGAEWDGASTE